MSVTYKICESSTAAGLETEVQNCLDVNYGLVGGPYSTAVIDSSNVITYKYFQAVKLNP